jgi:hypothetical protein
MEGSGGPAAASGDAQQQGGEATPEAQQFDPQTLVPQIGQIAQGLEELRSILPGLVSGQQDPGDTPDQPAAAPDLGFLGESLDPEVSAQKLSEIMDQMTQQRVEAALTPLQKQITDQRLAAESTELAGEFPELSDPAKAQELMNASKMVADHLNQADLAHEPQFMRIVLLAARGQEAARAEGGDAPRSATLEGGGVAAGASARSGGLTADSITGAQSGRSALPF